MPKRSTSRGRKQPKPKTGPSISTIRRLVKLDADVGVVARRLSVGDTLLDALQALGAKAAQGDLCWVFRSQEDGRFSIAVAHEGTRQREQPRKGRLYRFGVNRVAEGEIVMDPDGVNLRLVTARGSFSLRERRLS
jgi:hypothetical protein